MKGNWLIQRSRDRCSCRAWPVGGATAGRALKRFSSSVGGQEKLNPHYFPGGPLLSVAVSNMGTQVQNPRSKSF